MPNVKFNPFPFAVLVEVPVTRAERRWPKTPTPPGVINWVTFTRRTEDPKLAHLEGWLDDRGIAHRRAGESWHAPILQVPDWALEQAWELLEKRIGRRRFDDIPDDDLIFL